MKILSPAGNFESLKLAVFNGADEVYLGINDFNARNNIDGFSMSNLKEAVDFAHIYSVKVNLAINILFSDDEIQKALDIVVDAYNLGVDSFIIQDLGLIYLISRFYPEIEIHASTQMGIHNLEGVKFLEQFNIKRVVLARETPIEEIKRIRENSNVEIEYFVHGALCVSFSGNCYLSSYLFNASGNRGKCKQLCRLPYTLEKDGKVLKQGYLLSAKDFNMINRLGQLESAGVDVLKIEGRARRPYYVGELTRQYCNAINNKKIDNDAIKLAFNRNFTEGYFNGNSNVISNIQNHIGIFVANVEKVVFGKKFNQVYILSNRELYSKSSFKIFTNGKEKTTVSCYDLKDLGKGKYIFTTTQKLQVGDRVNLIVDAKKEQDCLNYVYKKDLNLDIYLEENKNIKVCFTINGDDYIAEGDILEASKTQPLTKEEVENNFNKNNYFNIKLNIKKFDKIFITKQKLNHFRRKVIEKIIKILTNNNKKQLNRINLNNKNNKIINFNNFQIINNLNNEFNKNNIIFSPETYNEKDIVLFLEKCKSLNKKGYLDIPNFALKNDIELLNRIISKTKIPIVANNYYALNFDTEIIIGAGLNVYNSYSANFYNKPIICAETNLSSKKDFPYMTLRHCPMKEHLNASCENCPYTDRYIYKMDNGKTLRLKRKKLSTCTFYLE